MNPREKLLAIREKLYEPILWAEELGIELLIEPHGMLTDSVDGMQAILDALGHEETIGVNLDTGNAWLGGGDPMQFVRQFGKRIKHVHWKDMGDEWTGRRGKLFGCGMGTIALGNGVVGIRAIVERFSNAALPDRRRWKWPGKKMSSGRRSDCGSGASRMWQSPRRPRVSGAEVK